MPLWTKVTPPEARLPGDSINVVDDSGWLDPDNKEIKVAIRLLHLKRKQHLDDQLNQILFEDGSGFFILESADPLHGTNPPYILNECSIIGPPQIDPNYTDPSTPVDTISNLPNNYSEDPDIMNVTPYRHRHS